MALNTVYRLTIAGTVFGEPVLNTWFFRVSVVGTGDERDNLSGALVATNWVNNYKACLSTNYTPAGQIIQAVLPVGTAKAYTSLITGGTDVNPSLPTQIAAIITRKTVQPGRGGRGRIFMPAVPTDFQNGDLVSGTGLTAYGNFCNEIILNRSSSGYTYVPCLFRRKAGQSLDLVNCSIGAALRTRRSRAYQTRFHRRKKRLVGSI